MLRKVQRADASLIFSAVRANLSSLLRRHGIGWLAFQRCRAFIGANTKRKETPDIAVQAAKGCA